jgi:hypothetical protein
MMVLLKFECNLHHWGSTGYELCMCNDIVLKFESSIFNFMSILLLGKDFLTVSPLVVDPCPSAVTALKLVVRTRSSGSF